MNLDIIKWKDFYLSDVFTKIEPGKVSQAYQLEEGVDIPYLGAKKDDNGIMTWCEANEELKSKGNCVVLICDGQGSVGLANYMESDFLGTVNLMLCYNENHLNQFTGLFLATVISQERPKYSFGRKWKPHLSDTLIKLPQTATGDPDWGFMEQYIKSLNYKPLTTANQGRYSSLTLGAESWKPFKVNDIFKLYNGKGITKEEIEYNQGDFIVVQSGEENNGCIGKIDRDYCNKMGYTYTEEPCLTVARSGSAGYVSYQPLGCVVGDSAKILTLKDDHHKNHSVFLFLKTVLMANRYKYTYGRKVTEDKYLSEVIMLPATTDNKPDFCFMENYIKSLPYGDRI